MVNQIESLPATERARLYREMAEETRKHAEAVAGPDLRATYLMLSGCWERLAEDLADELMAAEPAPAIAEANPYSA